MERSIFIKRPGSSTIRVRVFLHRPWQIKAAIGMRKAGHPIHAVCHCLSINRERLSKSFGPHAFFKL